MGTTSGAKSPYTPTKDAQLILLRVIPSIIDPTSVVTAGQFKLTCDTFTPNSIEVGWSGSGLMTAPAPQPIPTEWVVDQKVKAGVPITIEGRVIGAEANVTNEVHLWGLFRS